MTPEEVRQRAEAFRDRLCRAPEDDGRDALPQGRRSGPRRGRREAHVRDLARGGLGDVPGHGRIRQGAAGRRLTVPLRAINGDLYPTDVAANRKIKPDFDAIVMPHMGHYPMLERPDEFNRLVAGDDRRHSRRSLPTTKPPSPVP